MPRAAPCVWCALDPSYRIDGVCPACNTYRAKYGELPPPRVIDRRILRRCA